MLEHHTEHLHAPFSVTPGEGSSVATGYSGGPQNGLDAKRTIPSRSDHSQSDGWVVGYLTTLYHL
jgi:hypothetical protein